MQLHDTHFHLDLSEDPKQTVQDIELARIYTIAVTNLPELFDHTLNLTRNSKYIRAALGFHPELASMHKQQFVTFQSKLNLSRYVGEIGLDNFNKTSTDYSDQKKIFEKAVQLSHEAGNKILTVHSRRSENDVISTIGDNFCGKVILHWYSGSLKELEKAVSYGFYFSINYAMCKSDNGRRIIDHIPLDRLLIETDGPFVKIGNKVSTPVIAPLIADEILQLRRDTKEISKDFFYQNFRSLLI